MNQQKKLSLDDDRKTRVNKMNDDVTENAKKERKEKLKMKTRCANQEDESFNRFFFCSDLQV